MVNPSLIPGLGRSPGDGIGYPFQYPWVSLVAQMVKNLPTMRETGVRFLGWEDPLQEGQYSCLENPHGQRSLVGYSPWGRRESDATEQLHNKTNGDSSSDPTSRASGCRVWNVVFEASRQ